MILATRNGNREVRLFESSSVIPSWPVFAAHQTQVTTLSDQAALALPTVGAAIRLISETIGGLPLHVYQGADANKRKAEATWQWGLLHEEPNPDQSAFDLLCDISASVEAWGNAYVRKSKSGRRVVSLDLIDPTVVTVKRDGGQKLYELLWADGVERLTSAQVLHIRGFTPRGGLVGISPIAMHRPSLSSARSLQDFQARFYQNDATPSLYISVPGEINAEQARETKARWQAEQGGIANAGSVAVLGNGATLNQLTIPMRDAQFIETQQYGAELAARIFLGPAASLLGSDENQKTEEESLRFVNFCLLPRLRRIERALKADFDLFPDGAPLYPEFHIDEFLRADAATRAEVQHKQIQSGLLLIDEGRAELGRPPLPDGMGQIPQITPVGGAPNPAPPATAPTTEPSEQE